MKLIIKYIYQQFSHINTENSLLMNTFVIQEYLSIFLHITEKHVTYVINTKLHT